ncbi:uncharacterized protein SRS1_15893 [Sporisorium reilianum f. sp. reilianum]|uniref:Uncharacterized protein n=1 Tax=Sporisorium reilianum f. sp. reilianum TaxID=72559 RepID=A0A2N8UJH9_9BASI|nr:uncharacterized protein SRS1_15893 [Sporisorium reilianum f. sp. reilianum]
MSMRITHNYYVNNSLTSSSVVDLGSSSTTWSSVTRIDGNGILHVAGDLRINEGSHFVDIGNRSVDNGDRIAKKVDRAMVKVDRAKSYVDRVKGNTVCTINVGSSNRVVSSTCFVNAGGSRAGRTRSIKANDVHDRRAHVEVHAAHSRKVRKASKHGRGRRAAREVDELQADYDELQDEHDELQADYDELQDEYDDCDRDDTPTRVSSAGGRTRTQRSFK